MTTAPTVWPLAVPAASTVVLGFVADPAACAGRVGELAGGAARAGSVLVQKTLFCTDLTRTEAIVLVNALLAEGTECARHHCASF